MSDEEWWALYPTFLQDVKPNKLRYLQYRILNKALTTNVVRNRWNNQVSALCTFCKEIPEMIIHIMCTCPKIQSLWKLLQRTCKYLLEIDIQFTHEIIILNNYVGQRKELINLLIILLKQHIYAEKCFEKVSTFVNYMTKVSTMCAMEKCYAARNGKLRKCKCKWQNLFD